MSPQVSVVVGTYNSQRFLAPALDSLLAQTLREFELIAVDDGSTDHTAEILEDYQAKDSRVRLIRIKHSGIVQGLNTGLEAAQCEIIAHADADDLHHPDRLRKQFDFLQANPQVVAVGSRLEVIEPYGSPLRITNHKLTHEEIEAEHLAGSGWALANPAATFRKSVALKVGGFRTDYPFSEDFDFYVRMAEAGQLANLPEALVKYRLHSSSCNWKHHGTQMNNKPALLSEAYRRRGKTMPAGIAFPSAWDRPPGGRYVSWVWAALKDKNVAGARKHAWSALKSAPLSVATWRAGYCALRGY